MKISLKYFLPVTAIAVGALIAPVQAQTMQNNQNPTDRVGVDASDPYSEQVYSGSQETDATSGQMNNSPETMTNEQMPRSPQSPTQLESNQTDRIGIDASDPYSEQVYSGSQETDATSGQTSSRFDENSMEQPFSLLQQRRYEVLDRSNS